MHLSVSTFTPRHFPNCNESERTAAKNDKVLISGKGKSSGGISYYSQSVSRYAWNVFTAYQISKSSRRRGREGGEVFCPHQEKVSCNPPVSFKLFGVDMHWIDIYILQLLKQFKMVFFIYSMKPIYYGLSGGRRGHDLSLPPLASWVGGRRWGLSCGEGAYGIVCKHFSASLRVGVGKRKKKWLHFPIFAKKELRVPAAKEKVTPKFMYVDRKPWKKRRKKKEQLPSWLLFFVWVLHDGMRDTHSSSWVALRVAAAAGKRKGEGMGH